MSGLLTDLYELTMSAGYFEAGKTSDLATFELSIRRLPENRDFVLAAGVPQAIDYLLTLRFSADEIAYLQSLPVFARVSPAFFEYLGELRFTGDVYAVAEGTPLFAGEPVMTVRAPIIEAQVAETYLLAAFTFQTLIASKAARAVEAAAGRPVIEFGTRRAHTAEAGVLGARAAYIGGCVGTSNTLAGYRFGIPVYGTAAHSWIMSFPSEAEAFRRLQQLMGPQTVQLIDTYDPEEGARVAASLGKPLWGVRIDSGNLLTLSHKVRRILDDAGLPDARIMASGDLNECKIRDLMAAGAPIDAFGVGTELATSGDAPSMGTIYKLVEVESAGVRRPTLKLSEHKYTLPGIKQLFRCPDRDVLALAGECIAGGEPLLREVVRGGQLTAAIPTAAAAREHAAQSLRRLEGKAPRLERSPGLEHLTEEVRKGLR